MSKGQTLNFENIHKKIPNKHLVSVRGKGHNEKGDPSKYQGLPPHYPNNDV